MKSAAKYNLLESRKSLRSQRLQTNQNRAVWIFQGVPFMTFRPIAQPSLRRVR